jgi:hypothetical protein
MLFNQPINNEFNLLRSHLTPQKVLSDVGGEILELDVWTLGH